MKKQDPAWRRGATKESKQMVRLSLFLLAAIAAAETHTIYPEHHSRVFSAGKQPVLRIKSGDTVITRTWDSGGQDYKGTRHIQHPYVYPESGNPLMGPFYIEGAEYGDALEVRLDKITQARIFIRTCTRWTPFARSAPI
jgi:hypothetical protein